MATTALGERFLADRAARIKDVAEEELQ